MRGNRVGAAVIAAVIAAGQPTPAVAAPPPGACRDTEPARPPVRELPWAQELLAPQRVWPHSTGAGVVVAVVDSGVDADHPQLRGGRVLRGQDFFLVGDLPGAFDCGSHGTAVASIIAAAPQEGIGFRGLAPGARVLPIRVTDRDGGRGAGIDPKVLAQGIRYAADQGADIINLSLSGTRDDKAVRDAVAYAQSKDVLIIAAVGNLQGEGSLPSYPAGYDGVIGVGAVDISGARLESSQIGPYVDIVAPGGGVLGATRVAGHTYWDGTSFAAPFVAATAALVRSAWPDLPADQVARRLLATAGPSRGGIGSLAYGAGTVNPYRAVTEGLVDSPPNVTAPVVIPRPDPGELRAAERWAVTRSRSHAWTLVVLIGTAVALAAALTVPRGRRRRWAPGAAHLPAARPVRDEPPEQLFLLDPPGR
ncbi:type VII secretion-associated serine protease mycosin [Actinokineospora fastidiosa]|uniref:Peptidase S8/S53 domain-containing protein n=1 Tax=Actinokineospora fastidiosa TaxID=1816 RepID=A0A918GFM5_9PSEU|nr:type VII secretion-associated serine protease mycosin [Actinokineospora fastidiosa]GGS30008.1 hypothetical protein GCM10010171_24270 [Actinokineospora fastidiosa]